MSTSAIKSIKAKSQKPQGNLAKKLKNERQPFPDYVEDTPIGEPPLEMDEDVYPFDTDDVYEPDMIQNTYNSELDYDAFFSQEDIPMGEPPEEDDDSYYDEDGVIIETEENTHPSATEETNMQETTKTPSGKIPAEKPKKVIEKPVDKVKKTGSKRYPTTIDGIEEKILKYQNDAEKLLEKYNSLIEELKILEEKKKELQSKEIQDLLQKTDRSFEEILEFLKN